ncbi:3-hydroxyacyl-CoA dehydrogenase family protein [Saccharothrix sp. HUAS TT1]|uniref:3-hydroxyacyl-CoA dehydrogenase family protein n=1 Tax=unclassified Saccharothrix TaxID=2593673 RepID=UPI00345C1741
MLRFGIVGAGLMGHGIAVELARGGHRVDVHDADGRVLASLAERVDRALAACGSPVAEAVEVKARITAVADLADAVGAADVVVEAVPERVDVKHAVLAAVEAAAAPGVAIWSNTSVLPITEVAGAMARPERLVGVHWWNPPYLVPLVEVAPGARTDPARVEEADRLVTALGKTTVRLARDVPGFIGNRLQFAMVREALHLVAEGVCDPGTIDVVVRSSFGLRLAAVGPMENADYIGLELTRSILGNLAPHLSAAVASFPALDGRLAGGGRLPAWPPGHAGDVARRLDSGIRRNLAGASPDDGSAGTRSAAAPGREGS